MVRVLTESDKTQYDKLVRHIIQSWQWGEFREMTGVEVVRIGRFEHGKIVEAVQITFHKIPHLPFKIGYCPKGTWPTKTILEFVEGVSREKRAILVKFEPNETKIKKVNFPTFIPSPRSIFATHTFQVDLTKTEEELVAALHSKTRYNTKVAKKHGVTVEERNDKESFEKFLKLQSQTAARNKFFVHPDSYYRKMWKVLKKTGNVHLLCAFHKKELVATWILFSFGDYFYYPYGGSSEKYKNAMASNLLAWEALLFAKKAGAKVFDFWGAVGPDTPVSDPWYGFHRFKAGYGGRLVSFVGAYDLVVNKSLYSLFATGDRLRWFFLRLLKNF